jgi:dolichyl-phosphate beta-glucosyltransferase
MHAQGAERGREGFLVSLVFPTYNPGSFLDRTWQAVRQFLRSAPASWEVLFVCDGCTDGSPERLRDLTRTESDRVRVLDYAPNRGKGYAVRHGLLAATGKWRVFTDVDLAYGFDDVVRVVEALRAGADVAVASRLHAQSRLFLPPGLLGYAFRRHLQSLAFATLVRCMLPISQRDTQAGLKGLSARAAGLILPRLRCNGFGFDCELLTACVRHELEIAEVPVCVRFEDAASTTGLRSMGAMVRELWTIRRAWRDVVVPTTPTEEETGRRQAA